MSYPNTLYFPETAMLVCPYRMWELDFIVAYLFMPVIAGRTMMDCQRQARLRPPDWANVDTEMFEGQEARELAKYTDGLDPPPWRSVVRRILPAGQWSCLAVVALPPLCTEMAAARHIQGALRAATRTFNDVCVQTAVRRGMFLPSRNCFLPPMDLEHDWFVVYAALVKGHALGSENREEELGKVTIYRYLAEQDAKIATMLGGEPAAKKMADAIADAVEINFRTRQ